MRRIWMEPSEVNDDQFELSDEAFRHAIQVSRFRIDEEFEIVSGLNFALKVRLTEIKKKSATVSVIGRRELAALGVPQINLAFAVSKWSTFEQVVEKSVELGVTTFQPIISDFSFIRSKKDWPESRMQRLQKIIRGATEQCGRGPLMDLRDPLSLLEFTNTINRIDTVGGLFAYEGVAHQDVQSQLSQLRKQKLTEIWAIVGSEGGFSVEEVNKMQEMGLPPVTLGSQILRAETACLAMLSVIKYEFGLMR